MLRRLQNVYENKALNLRIFVNKFHTLKAIVDGILSFVPQDLNLYEQS